MIRSVPREFRAPAKRLAERRTWIHTMPMLANQSSYEENGIPGLYSAEGFKAVWTDSQKGLLSKLSQLVVETSNETRHPFHIMLSTARKADQQHVFNYASQAFNNHLFIESLTWPENNETRPSTQLEELLKREFGGIDGLKEAFISHARALYGNGWLFLVEEEDKRLVIKHRHSAGTPFKIRSSNDDSTDITLQEQSFDNLFEKKITEELKPDNSQATQSKEAIVTIPLLAVNLWQHAYLTDYSVAGRDAFLEAWWKSIDWNVVNSRLFRL